MQYTKEDIQRFEKYGDVANGVPFDWWLVNQDGAGFCLVPTRGVHTEEQVAVAKQKIKMDRDVVGAIRVFWLK